MGFLIIILVYSIVVGLIIIGWTLSLLGLPGNWLMLVVAAGCAWFIPGGTMDISWTAVLVISLLCIMGEIAEMLAGVWGTKRAGGSRRSTVFAMSGSFAGAILGGIVGLPIPFTGSAIGAIMGGCIGALIGAGLAELSLGESGAKSWQVGHAAFWGRLLGTGAKTLVATVIAAISIASLVL